MLNEKKIGKGGQLTIPAHIRRELGIQNGEKFAIRNDNGRLVLERVTGSCIICGACEELLIMNGKYLCSRCIEEAMGLLLGQGALEQELREKEAADVWG